MVNEAKGNIIFNIKTEGPFKIIATKPNSGSTHPLAATQPSSKEIGGKSETMSDLQPNKIVQMKIEFLPPSLSDSIEWPIIKSCIKKGRINIAFANGKSQFFNILGNLLKPKLNIVFKSYAKTKKLLMKLI